MCNFRWWLILDTVYCTVPVLQCFLSCCRCLLICGQTYTRHVDTDCLSVLATLGSSVHKVGILLTCLRWLFRREKGMCIYFGHCLHTKLVFVCEQNTCRWRHPSVTRNRQGYYFSGISGNLEMSGNLANVNEKSGKKAQSPGKVRKFVYSGKFDCGSSTKCR